jgi:hypothetical protein
MLDEIINYVQSLQRQVEVCCRQYLFDAFAVFCDVHFLTLYVHIVQFLSMKLSAVNPALDFNIERILSKDVCNPLPVIYTIGPSNVTLFSSCLYMFHCTVLSVSRNCIVCIWLLTRHRTSVFASTKTFSSCVPQHCELY